MQEHDKVLLGLVILNCILATLICWLIHGAYSYYQTKKAEKEITATVDLEIFRDSAPLPAKLKHFGKKSIDLEFRHSKLGFRQSTFLGNHVITFYSTETCIPGRPCHTATGTVPRHMATAAVDPRYIPLNSYIFVEGFGILKAEDTGGDIKGNRIDIYIDDYDQAVKLGRQTRKVYAVNRI